MVAAEWLHTWHTYLQNYMIVYTDIVAVMKFSTRKWRITESSKQHSMMRFSQLTPKLNHNWMNKNYWRLPVWQHRQLLAVTLLCCYCDVELSAFCYRASYSFSHVVNVYGVSHLPNYMIVLCILSSQIHIVKYGIFVLATWLLSVCIVYTVCNGHWPCQQWPESRSEYLLYEQPQAARMEWMDACMYKFSHYVIDEWLHYNWQ